LDSSNVKVEMSSLNELNNMEVESKNNVPETQIQNIISLVNSLNQNSNQMMLIDHFR